MWELRQLHLHRLWLLLEQPQVTGQLPATPDMADRRSQQSELQISDRNKQVASLSRPANNLQRADQRKGSDCAQHGSLVLSVRVFYASWEGGQLVGMPAVTE